MAQAPLREHYDSDEEYFRELDIFNTQVSSDLENITGSTGEGVEIGTDNEAYPTVGTIRAPYQHRYLHVRYGTSPTGAGFTDDYTTIPGLTVYQGLRNDPSAAESTNPASYIWRELNVSTGWIPSYRIDGGRLVDWDFSTVVPQNFLVDSGEMVIDLGDLSVSDVTSVNFISESEGYFLDASTGDAEFNNVVIRGNSTVESTTIGGTAAVIGTNLINYFDSTTDASGDTLTGSLFEGIVRDDGPVSITTEFLQIQFSGVSTGDMIDLTVTFTISELNPADDSVIQSVTLDAISIPNQEVVAPSSIFLMGSDDDNPTLPDISSGVSFSNSNKVLLSVVVESSSTETFTFYNYLADAVWTTVGKPADTGVAFISSNDPRASALNVIGGIGLKLNRSVIWEGSGTNPFLSNDALLRNGSVAVIRVQWDDSQPRTTYWNTEGGVAMIRRNIPTLDEVLPTLGSSMHYDSNEAIFTWDGRRVGSLVYSYSGTAPGFLGRYRVSDDNQDSSISNLVITQVSFEYDA